MYMRQMGQAGQGKDMMPKGRRSKHDQKARSARSFDGRGFFEPLLCRGAGALEAVLSFLGGGSVSRIIFAWMPSSLDALTSFGQKNVTNLHKAYQDLLTASR